VAFPKGKSGNPKGRPKVLLPDGRSLSDLAKEHTQNAIETLIEIMGDDGAPQTARITAANSLLDRGWGRPAQSVELTGANGGAIQHEITTKEQRDAAVSAALSADS